MKPICIIFILLASMSALAQPNYTVGLLPSINLSTSLPQGYKINLNTESRQTFFNSTSSKNQEFQYEYNLTDFTFIVSKKVGLTKTVAAGYLLRIREGEIQQRSIQQFILSSKYANFIISHRIATDQTFLKDEATTLRLRYRISAGIPLNGQTVDPGEFYLKLNHEYLNELQDGLYNLEIRVVPFLGFEISDKNKIELGLDFRINSFLEGASQSRYWTAINWYRSI
jgi:hypothetical protein